MESKEIQDMHDVYMYAAGLDRELEHLHYENAARLFISYQISAPDADDDGLFAALYLR